MSVSPGQTLQKDPDAELTYQFDWSAWLGSAEIATSTFTLTGADADLTKDNPSIVTGNQKTQVRLLGGTAGLTYLLTNRITTNESPAQTDDRTIRIKIVAQ